MTPQAAPAPRPVLRSAADWFKAKYPDGAEHLERWTAAGEIVIVEQKGD
ncbi:MAG: hypothetical protein STSR0009_31970 [Methanoregula sp.]